MPQFYESQISEEIAHFIYFYVDQCTLYVKIVNHRIVMYQVNVCIQNCKIRSDLGVCTICFEY